MKKYFIRQVGYGKYARYRAEPVYSERKLEDLKDKGVRIYDSKSEAERKAREMN